MHKGLFVYGILDTHKECNEASVNEKIARREVAEPHMTVSWLKSTVFVVQESSSVLTGVKDAVDCERCCQSRMNQSIQLHPVLVKVVAVHLHIPRVKQPENPVKHKVLE